MAQNLTALVSDNGNCSDTTAATSVVNFKPKDTNGWKDYKKLKTYLILKEQQNEKVTIRVCNKEVMPYYLFEMADLYCDKLLFILYLFSNTWQLIVPLTNYFNSKLCNMWLPKSL